ncbi:MAG: type IV pilus assembly protein PilP [Francisella sp.]|jgi:type IV pilus assembly protein PilP
MNFNKNIVKLLSTIILISVCNEALAAYSSQVKQVDELIQMNMKTIKSGEKLDIPEYKGDTLTFERLSKIRNVFNIDHFLPFEKRKIREPAHIANNKQKTVKLKPIIIPEELQKIMDRKKTALQSQSLGTFSFKGVVFQNADEWGVVESSTAAKPIYIQKGQFIGQDYGRIEGITKAGVLVKQWQKDEKERVWKSSQAVIH